MDRNGLPFYSLGKDIRMLGMVLLTIIGCVVLIALLSFIVQPFFNSLGRLGSLGSLTAASYYEPIARGDFNTVF